MPSSASLVTIRCPRGGGWEYVGGTLGAAAHVGAAETAFMVGKPAASEQEETAVGVAGLQGRRGPGVGEDTRVGEGRADAGTLEARGALARGGGGQLSVWARVGGSTTGMLWRVSGATTLGA